uniref:CULT domain-containing protein n=1 Tax=Pseudo-nitzschia australis TaxID=44445 RepID=A0A7S4APY0_9STRA
MSDHSHEEEINDGVVPEVEDVDDESILSSASNANSSSSSSNQEEEDHSLTPTTAENSVDNNASDSINRSIALPREHSYLEESHPLLSDEDHLKIGRGSRISPHGDFSSHDHKPNVKHTLELAVLELHGVVLFPGCTIPAKLQNRSMIRYLGRQIRLCRMDPVAQPFVKLGILPHEWTSPLSSPAPTLSQQRRHRRNETAQDERPSQRQRNSDNGARIRSRGARVQRGLWMRQRFSFGNREIRATASSRSLRQSFTRLRDEFQFENMDLNLDLDYDDDSESESNGENDVDVDENDGSSLSHQLSPKPSHPLVGRIGTIATVQYTHERTNMGGHDDDRHNDDSQSSSSLWRHYEEAPELVFTAVGTSRFRILSCINEDEDIFEVEEIHADPLVRPPISSWTIPFRRQKIDDDDNDNDDDENSEEHSNKIGSITSSDFGTIETRSTRLQTQTERMAWNLSQLTPVPYFVYLRWMPWNLVDKIVEALQTNNGRGNLPSLGEDSAVANHKKEPTMFSYWMANNAPFSEGERLQLLKMNSVLERLLFIWKNIRKWTAENTQGRICCDLCETSFTTVSDIFTVGGAEGTTSTYVNGQGFIHQITTLRNVDENKLIFQGAPSTENSYFPGYSWWITKCHRCGSHLGWKFQKLFILEIDGGDDGDDDVDNDNRIGDRDTSERPPYFYGFMSSNLKIKIRKR